MVLARRAISVFLPELWTTTVPTMKRKGAVGYFVENGKAGFCGFVRVEDPSMAGSLYVQISSCLADPIRRTGFMVYRVCEESAIDKWWSTVDKNVQNKVYAVPERWLRHREPWLFDEAVAAVNQPERVRETVPTPLQTATVSHGHVLPKTQQTGGLQSVASPSAFKTIQPTGSPKIDFTVSIPDQAPSRPPSRRQEGDTEPLIPIPQCVAQPRGGSVGVSTPPSRPASRQRTGDHERQSSLIRLVPTPSSICSEEQRVDDSEEDGSQSQEPVHKKRGRKPLVKKEKKGRKTQPIDNEYPCAKCQLPGKEHRAGSAEESAMYWCDLCGEWTYGACIEAVKEVKDIWFCSLCQATMKDMRAVKSSLKALERKIDGVMTSHPEATGPKCTQEEWDALERRAKEETARNAQLNADLQNQKKRLLQVMSDLEAQARTAAGHALELSTVRKKMQTVQDTCNRAEKEKAEMREQMSLMQLDLRAREQEAKAATATLSKLEQDGRVAMQQQEAALQAKWAAKEKKLQEEWAMREKQLQEEVARLRSTKPQTPAATPLDAQARSSTPQVGDSRNIPQGTRAQPSTGTLQPAGEEAVTQQATQDGDESPLNLWLSGWDSDPSFSQTDQTMEDGQAEPSQSLLRTPEHLRPPTTKGLDPQEQRPNPQHKTQTPAPAPERPPATPTKPSGPVSKGSKDKQQTGTRTPAHCTILPRKTATKLASVVSVPTKGLKRTAVASPVPLVKRRRSGKEGVLCLSDSMLRSLARSRLADAYAWRNNWEVVTRSGSTIKDIVAIFRTESGRDFRQKEKIIISVGSNDLDNNTDKSWEDRTAYTSWFLQSLSSMVDEAKYAGIQVGVMLPTPRASVVEAHRTEFNQRLTKLLDGYPNTTIINVQGTMDPTTFLADCLFDGTHYADDFTPEVLSLLATSMKEPPFEEDTAMQLGPLEVLEDGVCGRCGQRHTAMKGGCQASVWCPLCRSRKHTPLTCLEQYHMCRKCGDRSHRAKDCNTWIS